MSLLSRRPKKETVETGTESSSVTESPMMTLARLVDDLQSTLGITLRNMRVGRSVSSSSTNSVLWVVELGLSLSKESQEKIDGFSYQQLQEILGSITSRYSWPMVYFVMRRSLNESMSCTLRLQSTQRLSNT